MGLIRLRIFHARDDEMCYTVIEFKLRRRAMTAKDIAQKLNEVLCIERFSDVSNNGLQIENEGSVTRIAFAVDASLETFEAAIDAGAQMVVVHHGLSWGNSLARIEGLNYQLVAYAIRHNLAVYGVHLPLDAHPTLGNNAGLANCLNLQERTPFFEYHGQTIGVAGRLPHPLSCDAFLQLLRDAFAPPSLTTFLYGPETIHTVGICSGGAPEGVEAAARANLDAYLCGEANLVAYNLAKGWGINAIFAGHYATERFGVRALQRWAEDQLHVETHFIDFNLPL